MDIESDDLQLTKSQANYLHVRSSIWTIGPSWEKH